MTVAGGVPSWKEAVNRALTGETGEGPICINSRCRGAIIWIGGISGKYRNYHVPGNHKYLHGQNNRFPTGATLGAQPCDTPPEVEAPMLQVEQVERLRTVTWNISEEFALKVPIDLVETEELNLGIDTLSREVRTSVPPKESPNWEEEFSVEGEGVSQTGRSHPGKRSENLGSAVVVPSGCTTNPVPSTVQPSLWMMTSRALRMSSLNEIGAVSRSRYA